MRINVPRPAVHTHTGGTAAPQNPVVELERTVANCLLWENTFYEGGDSIANRIAELCKHVDDVSIMNLAIKARTEHNLRHVPLWLVIQMLRKRSKLVAHTIEAVIHRPDEMTELLALYWKDGRVPLAAQLKKGLARAYKKFSEYQLAKWNRADAIKLRDVMFLCHPKPTVMGTGEVITGINRSGYKRGPVSRHKKGQGLLWYHLVTGTLEPADTWEKRISAIGQDTSTSSEVRDERRRRAWTELLEQNKLGETAILKNMLNMYKDGVSPTLIATALSRVPASKVFPGQYITAVKAAPMFVNVLDRHMADHIIINGFSGKTLVLVDVSGSMDKPISAKSVLSRWEAAAGLAIQVAFATSTRIFTFSTILKEVIAAASLATVAGIAHSQPHSSTYLARSVGQLVQTGVTRDIQRLIVITDEQSQDGIPPAPVRLSYLINVAPYAPGLDTSQGWTRISGWSDKVLHWIIAKERAGC